MKTYSLLGVNVNSLTIEALIRLIAQTVEKGKKTIIANHNLHSVYLFHREAKMRSFYDRADYIYIDGMPLVFWARVLGIKLKLENRVTLLDWIAPLLTEAAKNNWRIFYLGGRNGIAEKARQKINGEFPRLELQCHHGFFERRGAPNQEVLAEIRDFRPHVLLVGMGMPLQECWIADNYHELAANVILNAGACFDYLAGAVPTPPRWLGKIGLEGIYRLVHEPRRLWKRYLYEPWFILPQAIKDLVRLLKRPV
jgi:N-acetylglucosaminyldiphosphoundecaprenol N-acetyl-beta-D-mannosaminyltransferase